MQTPRGWGLFLIKNMVDEMRVTGDGTHHYKNVWHNAGIRSALHMVTAPLRWRSRSQR